MTSRLRRRTQITVNDRHVDCTLDSRQSNSQLKAATHQQYFTDHGNCFVREGKSSKGSYYAKGNRR